MSDPTFMCQYGAAVQSDILRQGARDQLRARAWRGDDCHACLSAREPCRPEARRLSAWRRVLLVRARGVENRGAR